MEFSRNTWIALASSLIVGLLLGALLFGGGATTDDAESADAQLESEEASEQTWTCSMHPSVRADQPGTCPICGMDLIPVGDLNGEEDDRSLVMSETAMRLAQVQTTEVTRETPNREVDLPGRVEVDERRITTITAHFDGRIRNLNVDFTGSYIQQGQQMATIYSPDLIAAQRELLEAIRYEDTRPEMAESARRKLRLWELSESEIERVEESGEVQRDLAIHSPVSGYVTERNVSREQHVREGDVLYEVADLSRVWLIFEAYEEDIEWLSVGDHVSYHTRSNPGQNHIAEVTYIDPVLDGSSRTVRVRAEAMNPDNQLKPDMMVRGSVYSEGRDGAQLVVPASSVIWTGPRSIVYVQDMQADVPRFEAREVDLGSRTGDHYIIHDGVQEGEHVVTHGAFKIDSEFQMADRFSMMNPQPERDIRPAGAEVAPDDDPAEEQFISPDERFHDEAPDAFREQLTAIVEAYLDAKDALYASDEESARTNLSEMEATLEAVDAGPLSGDAHEAWMQDYHAMKSHLDHVDHLQDIEELRGEFHTLSRILAYSVQQFGIDGVIYQQYCPMSFDGDGAQWLSREEEIANPYLPDHMPDCGEVIERIE